MHSPHSLFALFPLPECHLLAYFFFPIHQGTIKMLLSLLSYNVLFLDFLGGEAGENHAEFNGMGKCT